MLPVPSGHAQAGSVLALAMLVAPWIAQLVVAVLAAPSGITAARLADASPVLATVQIAQLLGAILTAPLGLAGAGLRVQIERTVAGAVGQTLQCVLVHRGTVRALPALLADAGTLGTEPMPGTGRMGTVNWNGKERAGEYSISKSYAF